MISEEIAEQVPVSPATGRKRFASQDFWSALMVGCFAALAVAESLRFPVVPGEIGPGFFPFWIGVLLAVFALLLLVNALRGRSIVPERVVVRPLALAMAGILAFAVLMPIVGGLLAMVSAVTIVSYAEPGRTLREVVLLNIAIIIPAWLIFVIGLSVQIPMF